MKPTFEDVSSFAIMGVSCRNSPDKIDYTSEWQRFDAYQKMAAPLSSDERFFAAYFMPKPNGDTIDFIAGMAVDEETEAPHDTLVVRIVPAGRYAVFSCTMKTISQTWRNIYGDWEPPEGLQIDHTRPDLEIFQPEGSGAKAPVRILIPLSPI